MGDESPFAAIWGTQPAQPGSYGPFGPRLSTWSSGQIVPMYDTLSTAPSESQPDRPTASRLGSDWNTAAEAACPVEVARATALAEALLRPSTSMSNAASKKAATDEAEGGMDIAPCVLDITLDASAHEELLERGVVPVDDIACCFVIHRMR